MKLIKHEDYFKGDDRGSKRTGMKCGLCGSLYFWYDICHICDGFDTCEIICSNCNTPLFVFNLQEALATKWTCDCNDGRKYQNDKPFQDEADQIAMDLGLKAQWFCVKCDKQISKDKYAESRCCEVCDKAFQNEAAQIELMEGLKYEWFCVECGKQVPAESKRCHTCGCEHKYWKVDL